MEFNKSEQSLYYGFCYAIFTTAGYKLSGGAFNLSLIFGGMIFERVITINIMAMFIGGFLGCLVARMFYDQFLRTKSKEEIEEMEELEKSFKSSMVESKVTTKDK